MLDGLLGRGFAAKCKSLIKLTRSRIDVIRRKRQATQKFLKKDMADLLANGLDINAYGRAEGLLVELTLSSCYDFVELCCEFLLKHMLTMQKQSECPEECREAVSSLMFAAARFSDLPELRDLRKIFQERYGNSLDCFINQEFSDKLAGNPSTLEKKVKLMQDIASESSIRWDSRAFEQRMSRTSSTVQEQPKDHGLLSHATDYSKLVNAKYIPLKGEKPKFPPKQSFEVDEGRRFRNNTEANGFKRNDLNPQPKLESTGNKRNDFEDIISRKDDHDIQQGRPGLTSYKTGEGTSLKQVISGASSHERRHKDASGTPRGRLGPSSYKIDEDSSPKQMKSGTCSHEGGYKDTDGGLKQQNRRERTVLEREHRDGSLHWKQGTLPNSAGTYIKTDVKDAPSANDDNGNEDRAAYSLRKAKGDEIERSYCKSSLPPPYVKPNVKPPKDGKYGSKSESVFEGWKVPSAPKSEIPGPFIQKVHLGSSYSDDERKDVGLVRVTSHGDNKQFPYHDNIPGCPIPKPKSVRRKHSKSRSAHDEIDYGDARTVRRPSRSRRKDDSRQGLQILFDDERDQKDEEEMIIDKLLMHYCKKPAAHEAGKVRRKSRSRRAHGSGTDVGESPVDSNRPKYDEDPEIISLPPRSVSLPREQTTTPLEPAKVFTRATSFQPDRPNPARHVHPNLPDYDELAARLAALRGS